MAMQVNMESFDVLHDYHNHHKYAPQNLLRGIYAYGFEKPSKIQQCATLPIINS